MPCVYVLQAYLIYCTTLEHCPFGKKEVILQCDGHSSNRSVEFTMACAELRVLLLMPCSHSTHLTQQLDQRGGPIQMLKYFGRSLLCMANRVYGKITRAIEVPSTHQLLH